MYIKFPSHRQRDAATRIVGRHQEYFSFVRDTGYGVINVTPEVARKLKENGVRFTKLRGPWDDIRQCMDMGY